MAGLNKQRQRTRSPINYKNLFFRFAIMFLSDVDPSTILFCKAKICEAIFSSTITLFLSFSSVSFIHYLKKI